METRYSINNMSQAQKLATLFNAPIEAGVNYKVDYLPNLNVSQILFYHLTIDGKTQVGKVVYQNK